MDISARIITKSARETQKVGEELAHQLNNDHIFCLYGELGSGKTTFIQGFVRGLGLSSRLLSPTFIIVRRYSIPGLIQMLYHIDLYRIKKAEELTGLGLSEILADPTNLVVIEWADRLRKALPDKRIDITFTPKEGDVRILNIRHYGK